MKIRVLLLASGDGSLVQAVIDAVKKDKLDIHIVGLVCDQPGARVIERVKAAGIATYLIPIAVARQQWDKEIWDVGIELNPDLIVSAGFMRILSPEFVQRFKVINSHPSLLPNFPGVHAVKDALLANVAMTGTTIHWVDSGVDTGEIIAQVEIAVVPNDDIASLHERIKIVERGLIVETISKLLPTLEKRHV